MWSARDGTVGVAYKDYSITLQATVRRVNARETRSLRKGMILNRY